MQLRLRRDSHRLGGSSECLEVAMNIEGLTDSELERLWRQFTGDWEMFTEGALYETFPDLKPWALLTMKQKTWNREIERFLAVKQSEGLN
jgi:hypothetical protein